MDRNVYPPNRPLLTSSCLMHYQVQSVVAHEIGTIDLKAPFTATELLELISRLHDQVSKVVSGLSLRFALGTDKVPAMEASRGGHKAHSSHMPLVYRLLLYQSHSSIQRYILLQ